MQNSKKNGTVVGMTSSAPTIKVDGEKTTKPQAATTLQERLAAMQALNKKIRVREAFQTHLDILNASEIDNPNDEHEEDKNTVQKITLKFGYNETYDITSPSLLSEIRLYLVDRITVRMSELDTEILKAAI
jgi:hypothetical protein